MPLIECTAGPAETPVGGTVYSFNRDKAGRYVADVYDLSHAMCLLSVVWYREVKPISDGATEQTEQPSEETPAAPVEKPVATARAKKVKTETPSGFGLLGVGGPTPTVPAVEAAAENAAPENDVVEDAVGTDESGDGSGSEDDTGADDTGAGDEGSDDGSDETAEDDTGGQEQTEQPSEETPAAPIVLPTATPTRQGRRRNRRG